MQTVCYTLASWIQIFFYLGKILITANAADFNGMTVWSILSSVFKALVCILKNSNISTELLQYRLLWIIPSIIAKLEDIFKKILNSSFLLEWDFWHSLEIKIVPVIQWLFQSLSYWFSTKNISMLCNCPGKAGWHRATPFLAQDSQILKYRVDKPVHCIFAVSPTWKIRKGYLQWKWKRYFWFQN